MKPNPLAAAAVLAFLFAPLARGQEQKAEPISPKDGVIRLFNGQNLDGWYTWLKDTKHEDPRGVFSVTDGMLHISGDGLGGLITKNEYRNYHLVAEFKWGPRTWGARKERTKDSGILVHCVGPDGNYNDTWMASIEAQVIEGGCGDFILVGGKYADGSSVPMSLTCEVTKDRDGENVWQKGGERKTFNRGRINWFGRDPDWKDVLGFRGKDDVESPDGEWTRMEVICDGGTITNRVNGMTVNQGFDAFPSSGKILIQTELAEIFFRKVELWPLGKAPKAEKTPSK
jgi:hypothetical protein